MHSSTLARNILKVTTGDIASRALGFVSMLLLIRGLGINDYAAYTAFLTVMSLSPGLVGNGLNLALVRLSAEHISRTHSRPLRLYFVNMAAQCLLYVSICVVALIMIDSINELLFGRQDFTAPIMYGLVGGFGSLLMQFGRTTYQAEENFNSYVLTIWLRQIGNLVVIGCLFFAALLNFRSAVSAVVLVELIIGLIIVLVVFKNVRLSDIREVLGAELVIIRDFCHEMGWLIAYYLILAIMSNLSVFMLSHLSSAYEIAVYGVAFRYYSVGLLLLGAIHTVLVPRFSKVDMLVRSRQLAFTFKWLKTTSWLIIPIAAFDLVGKSVFVWINGLQYVRSFYVFIVLSFGIWLSLMFSPLVNVLVSRNRFRFLLVLAAIALAVNLVGSYMLIPVWGSVGAAVVVVFSYASINIAAGVAVLFAGR